MPDTTNLTEGERLVKLNETNTAIVRQAIEDIGNLNVEGLLAIIDDDIDFRLMGTSPISRKLRGKEAYMGIVAEVGSYLDGFIELTVDELIPAGDWVIVRASGHAVMKATGADYDNEYCMMWKLQDGMVVKLREYTCTKLIMEHFFPD
ncbi:nuclear transport factor 2 family protein [Pseudomonadota bacterium]